MVKNGTYQKDVKTPDITVPNSTPISPKVLANKIDNPKFIAASTIDINDNCLAIPAPFRHMELT